MMFWILWTTLALSWNLNGNVSSYGVGTEYRIPVSFWPTLKTQLYPGRFLWNRVNLTWDPQWGSAFSGRLSLEIQPMIGDSWSLRFFEMRYDESRMHGGDTLWKDTRWGIRLLIYRANLQWMAGPLRVRIGRLQVTQGLTYMYSPLDFYGPRQTLTLDPEFLPGMDALEVTGYPLGDLRIRAVWPARYESLPVSFSSRFWMGTWEMLVLGTRKGGGAAVSHPLWQGILRAEGLWQDGRGYGSANYDRFFQNDFYLLVEIFQPPPGGISGFTPIQVKDSPYAAILIQKTFNPLWTFSLLWVEALTDRSFLVVPALQYAIANSATLEFRADLAIGQRGDVFDPEWFRPLVLLAFHAFF